MSKSKRMVFAVCASIACMELTAEENTDLENKSFLIGQHKSLGQGYLVHQGLKLESKLLAADALVNPANMVRAMFMYQNKRIKLGVVNSDGHQRCLTSVDQEYVDFRICEDNWDAQQFELVEISHASGIYWIQHGDKCLTKDEPFLLRSCNTVQATQHFTPSMVSSLITYSVVNENAGSQKLIMGFEPENKDLGQNIWGKISNVPGKSTITEWIPDYIGYGIPGSTWVFNHTYSSSPVYFNKEAGAGDHVTITMPLKGDIKQQSIAATVPEMTADENTRFRISEDQGDVAIWWHKGITSWSIPEGWILNVYSRSNFEDSYTQLTSTSKASGVSMPNRVGSIAIVQRADMPIRMRSDDEHARYGEMIVSANGTGEVQFYRQEKTAGKKLIGPMDSGKDNEVGLIRAAADSFVTTAENNAFYLRKLISNVEVPFSNRTTWEPLNIVNWWSHDQGFQGELYATYNSASNLSYIWRLKRDGAAAQCLPSSGDDENWRRVGSVYGEVGGDASEGVLLFSDKGYQGEEAKIVQDAADLCNMSNIVSSYKIPSGWQVQFFTGKNYTGSRYTRSGESTTLGGFDDKIQSIKIIKRK